MSVRHQLPILGGALGLALLCLALTGTNAAAAAECPALHTNVQVLEKIAAQEIDSSRDAAEIARLRQGDREAGATEAGGADTGSAGLTLATLAVEQHVVTQVSDTDDDTVCVSPSLVSVELETAPRIFVNADDDRCRRDAATAHELGHTVIDRQMIARYAPIFERRIREMAEEIGGVAVPDGGSAAAIQVRIAAKIDAVIALTYDEMAAERAGAQRDYDSPEAFRRLALACAANRPELVPAPAQPGQSR